ncbi:outer membrane beta-barrel protein [Dysgonomonas sp.]
MKKIVLTLAITIMAVVSANAQGLVSIIKEKISFGFKAEGNYSGFILSKMDNVKSTMGFGGSIGPSIKFNISKNFAIQEDILFTYASSGLTTDGVKDTYQYFGTEVPVYLIGQWGTPSGGRICGGVGPYVGYGFTAKMKDSDVNLYKKVNGETPMKRMTAGVAAQLGYQLKCGLQVSASYRIGFTNALDTKMGDSKMLPHAASLGIGYYF